MPAPSSSYGWNRALNAKMQMRYITDAVRALGNTLNYEDLDVLYIVPTRAAREIWFSPTYMGPVKMMDGKIAANTVTFGQDVWNQWVRHSI
jgi:hypothetical protein